MPKDGEDTIDLNGDSTTAAAEANDTILGAEGSDEIVVETPRDERHDSIDPATGTLTAEAVALRAERAAAGEAGTE